MKPRIPVSHEALLGRLMLLRVKELGVSVPPLHLFI